MKAITLYEPWATFIAMGLKTIETRIHDRFKCLVGERIAIHAGKKYDPRALYIAFGILAANGQDLPGSIRPRSGEVVCTVYCWRSKWLDTQDSRESLFDCSRGDRFGIFLSDIEIVNDDTIVKGHQGIWNWSMPETVT